MTDFAWTHLLYRLYDADEQLLYVGRTNDLKQRFKQHARVQPWWGDVARSAVETLPDLDALKASEKTAILGEKPKHNIIYNGRVLSDGFGVTGMGWLTVSPRVTALAEHLHKECGVPISQEYDYDDPDAPPCHCCAGQAIELITLVDRVEGRVDEAVEAAEAQLALDHHQLRMAQDSA